MIIRRSLTAALLGLALLAIPALTQTLPVLESPPENADPAARYVFYLHGQIIETAGRRPTHPQFGIYEYDAILNALAESGAQVISEQRPPNSDVGSFASRVADQVQSLLSKGVPATQITVVGFSKGGRIAIATSSLLREPISYVFLAACNAGVFNEEAYQVSGRVLSIYEESDQIGISCSPLLTESREVRIATGRFIDHGTSGLLKPSAG